METRQGKTVLSREVKVKKKSICRVMAKRWGK